MALLEVEDLHFHYPGGFRMESVELALGEQEFLALIGPNGSGKTTLLQLMSGLLECRQGRVLLQGTQLGQYTARQRAQRLAVISSEQYFEFPFPVREVVAMGRFPHAGRLGGLSSADRSIIEEAMELTRVGEFAARSVAQLSSGERQRVLIARALAQRPALLMLDEPNAHLDIHHQLAIFRLLQKLQREHGLTIVVVLHDLTAAAAFSQRVALLDRGRLVARGTPREVITSDNIRRVYGVDVEVDCGSGRTPRVSWRVEAG